MKSLTTRFLMTCAAIGAASGVLLVPVNHISAIFAPTMPILYAGLVGFWLLGPVLGLALLRRPGAGVLTTLIAGLVNVPLTPFGPSAVVTCLMVGVAIEFGFAVTLYRIWRPWLFSTTTVGFTAIYAAMAYVSFDMASTAVAVQALFFVLMVGSAGLATWAGLVLAQRVAKTGVTRGLVRPMGA
ncbi:ECF transporter S component [Dactylosporangium fulvum]|uniref:ECF transporter S component n=1 Tax=Dactylosporangium fulvum TaxID=53359 RepID=A0ABY5VYI3_9ACTN|nr:ECF transporter S component [Dactylosporangium fulvum]UWP81869.1 ECF transporter S component [Dactylosporangium fulvum]